MISDLFTKTFSVTDHAAAHIGTEKSREDYTVPSGKCSTEENVLELPLKSPNRTSAPSFSSTFPSQRRTNCRLHSPPAYLVDKIRRAHTAMVTLSLPATAVVCLSRALGAGSLGTSSALPQSPSQSQHPANDLSTLAELMPESALPPPDSSRELKYVLLGVGTQNYTCASGDESAVPGTTGAVGKLSISCSSTRH